MVRALPDRFRHGRDQQHVLSSSRAECVRALGETGAAGFHLRGESQPLYHSRHETQRLCGTSGQFSGPRPAVAATSWADPLPIATALEGGCKSSRTILSIVTK